VSRATAQAAAITRGRAFLVAQQLPDGRWPDPGGPGTGSDWVTGLVGRSAWALLADTPRGDGLHAALDSAFDALTRRQQANGGWGHDGSGNTDAESTAWALVCLLSERRRAMYSLRRARQYLSSHRDPVSGGFRLHATVDGGAGAPSDDRPPGEDDTHPAPANEASPASYVTALALRALLMSGDPGRALQPAREYLIKAQGADGLWRSPLWNVTGAPTLITLTTLLMTGELPEETRARAIAGQARLLGHADPVECAAAVVAAPHLALGDGVEQAIHRLLESQGPDGAWTPLVGIRRSTDAPERGRLLTTVMALVALHLSSH
jgi:hypothetical protein